jgi:hypothetical protein
MSNQAYIDGFMAKCAEYGVDPQEVVKYAARGDYLRKGFDRALKFVDERPGLQRKSDFGLMPDKVDDDFFELRANLGDWTDGSGDVRDFVFENIYPAQRNVPLRASDPARQAARPVLDRLEQARAGIGARKSELSRQWRRFNLGNWKRFTPLDREHTQKWNRLTDELEGLEESIDPGRAARSIVAGDAGPRVPRIARILNDIRKNRKLFESVEPYYEDAYIGPQP